MFTLNEKVVYPGHGVAKINSVVEKIVGGSTTKFFELSFFNKDMTILIPMSSSEVVGLRPLSSREKIKVVIQILSEPIEITIDNSASNWNKRNKEYQSKLRSGNICDICRIYRDLKLISSQKELSFGEKNLLTKTEMLLAEEIAIVTDIGEEKTIEQLRSIFAD